MDENDDDSMRSGPQIDVPADVVPGGDDFDMQAGQLKYLKKTCKFGVCEEHVTCLTTRVADGHTITFCPVCEADATQRPSRGSRAAQHGARRHS